MHEPDHPETDLTETGRSCGTPAQHIVSESQKVSDTLIVMATHRRVGVGRWVMGSVTDKVLHAVKTPVLIIHGA
jgi:nucleotide-binding universal stress UspA family protein